MTNRPSDECGPRAGTLTWPDGDSYVGAWEGGARQGWGAFYWNNGNSYQVE